MRIAVITCMWKRPEVFQIFGEAWQRIKDNTTEDVEVFCVGSEGNTSRELAEMYGFKYGEYPNDHLGPKWNHAVNLSKSWNPDWLLFVGSDDIMNMDLFNEYVRRFRNAINGPHYIGVYDWYFYDLQSKRALYWAGYNKDVNRGHFCGAGRAMNRQLVNSLGWQIWLNDRLHNLLDTSMDCRLNGVAYSTEGFYVKDYGIGLDVKSKENMTPFALWDNTVEIKPTEVKKAFRKIL